MCNFFHEKKEIKKFCGMIYMEVLFMNELEEIKIENLIYEIRGKQVMLDSDLAKLYRCKNGTKTINQAVKRHINRFPERYMFQITKEEYSGILRSQFGTLELKQGHYSKFLPYVFTEEGVAMLATVLRTTIAEEVSIRIMDAFVAMRKFINENKDIFKRLTTMEYKMLEYDDNFDKIFTALEPKKLENQKIFFNGEIYDAYSLIIELIKEASVRIIIIDNYIDKSILDILVYKKEKVKVELVTGSHYLTKLDITRFNQQYSNLNIKYSNIFYDRFIIIDNSLYHIGASLKDLGKKCFGINKIEDKEYLNKILSSI